MLVVDGGYHLNINLNPYYVFLIESRNRGAMADLRRRTSNSVVFKLCGLDPSMGATSWFNNV